MPVKQAWIAYLGARGSPLEVVFAAGPVKWRAQSEVIAHGLAATGDGDVQGAVRIGGQGAHVLGDGVGGNRIVRQAADVIEFPPTVVVQYVDVLKPEFDRRQVIVADQKLPCRLTCSGVNKRTRTAEGGGGRQIDGTGAVVTDSAVAFSVLAGKQKGWPLKWPSGLGAAFAAHL